MKYSKEYVILNRDHWTGSDVIHVIELGVVAMLVVTTEMCLVPCPLYISWANTIDVTGDTSSRSTGSVLIWKIKQECKTGQELTHKLEEGKGNRMISHVRWLQVTFLALKTADEFNPNYIVTNILQKMKKENNTTRGTESSLRGNCVMYLFFRTLPALRLQSLKWLWECLLLSSYQWDYIVKISVKVS